MKKYGFLLLLFLLAFSALAREEYLSDEIIIKLKPLKAAQLFEKLERYNSAIKSQSLLGNLVKNYEIKGSKKLFYSPETEPQTNTMDAAISPVKTNQEQIKKLEEDMSLFYVIKLPENISVEAAVKAYQNLPEVEYAGPNYIMRAFITPNDPAFSAGYQWGLTQVNSTLAWEYGRGATNEIIATVDSGADYNHPDLSAKIIKGYDYVYNDDDPMDEAGHGTSVAGVIAASTNNNTGIAGMAWHNKVLAVKALASNGSDVTGSYTDVANAIKYAADHSARVINMSIGSTYDSPEIKAAIQYAYARNCVLIAAAGNDNKNQVNYPAGYSEVLAVAATDSSNKKSIWSSPSGSNYGTWIGVCAPGTSIYSTLPSTGYAYSNGTSLATPFVSGLAGLILSNNPSFTPTEVYNKIKNSAKNIDNDNPSYAGLLGSGLIDASRALGGPTISITYPTAADTVTGKINILGTVTGEGFISYKIETGYGASPTSWKEITTSTTPVLSGILASWQTVPGDNGTYKIKATLNTAELTTFETYSCLVYNPSSIVGTSTYGPNPYTPNPSSAPSGFAIRYTLSTASLTKILIFNLNGNLIWQNTFQGGSEGGKSGDNLIYWNGQTDFGDIADNGVYIFRVLNNTNNTIASGKIILVK